MGGTPRLQLAGNCEIIIVNAIGGRSVARAEGDPESILLHDISMEKVIAAKVSRDFGGHYSRPDVFSLKVNRKALFRVREDDDENN